MQEMRTTAGACGWMSRGLEAKSISIAMLGHFRKLFAKLMSISHGDIYINLLKNRYFWSKPPASLQTLILQLYLSLTDLVSNAGSGRGQLGALREVT